MAMNEMYRGVAEELRFRDFGSLNQTKADLESAVRGLFANNRLFEGFKLVGSAATGTMFKDSKDLDYIAIFSGHVDNGEFKEVMRSSGLHLRKITEEARYGYIKVVGDFAGYEFVFVPSRHPSGEIETYVDDAFYHPDLIAANKGEDHVENVLLAKQFFKRAGAYAAVQGISCELMILKFGQIESLLDYLVRNESLRVNFSPYPEKYSDSPLIVDYPFLGRRSLVKNMQREDYERIRKVARAVIDNPRVLEA